LLCGRVPFNTYRDLQFHRCFPLLYREILDGVNVGRPETAVTTPVDRSELLQEWHKVQHDLQEDQWKHLRTDRVRLD